MEISRVDMCTHIGFCHIVGQPHLAQYYTYWHQCDFPSVLLRLAQLPEPLPDMPHCSPFAAVAN